MKPFQPGAIFDSVGPLPDGINSDVPPVLLPKTQAAYAKNATFRGGFATPRSAYKQIDLTFTSGQSLFEQKIWQGACYYKPDSGLESIIASIGGRLFKVLPGTQDDADATVEDITPASGGASESPDIAWLWQGERWVIRQDGEATPMIFDGNSSRYAKTGVVLGTLAADAAIPSIGASVLVTLVSEFTGIFGQTVVVLAPNGTNRGRFQVNQYSDGSILVRLKNVGDVLGELRDSGSVIEITNNYSGTATSAANILAGGIGSIGINPPFTGPVGSILHWGLSGNFNFRVTAVTPTGISIQDISGVNSPKLIMGNPYHFIPRLQWAERTPALALSPLGRLAP